MPSPIPYEHIRQITDQASFVDFLRRDLAWPIPEHLDSFDPVAVPYDMFDDLGYKPKDEPRLQVSRLLAMQRGQPWGVFLFKLNTPRIYITDLRKIVRKLSSRRELMRGMPIWKAEHILIIATADWQGFQFLHLRGGDAARAEIHSFGWQGPDDGFLRTLCEFNLPRLRIPEKDLIGEPDPKQWIEDWQAAFDVEAVTKAFFKEIANWYFWALHHVTFPKDAPKETDGRDHVSVIRLITRLVFCWFVKEKGLIPKTLFDQNIIETILNGFAPDDDAAGDSVFYKAILQNLFFATLNTEMDKRGWAKEEHNFMAHSLYRFRESFQKPGEALALFKNIPFLNGGLFECLDKDLGENAKPRYVRIDGFSRRADSQCIVPDFLFFGQEREVDLSEEYGDKKFKRVPVRGLIHTLQHYRFTIEENTPLEIEVALDPELAGRIFENLLAAFNPETGVTARKQTGSFYTPRQIVNYMVDESLIAYFKQSLTTNTTPPSALPACVAPPLGGDAALATAEVAATETQRALSADPLEQNLRQLFAYTAEPPAFAPAEIKKLIAAIDNLKALDPAVGSGAFPMGMLHRLVFLLAKLDPKNEIWRERQRQRALRETDETFKIGDKDERARRLEDINNVFEQNASDYGRKLYLIENCIYGVDIQPIAAQIAKMRFFISLIVDQKVDPAAANLGVRPLPNLETKFVAANSLIGIDRPGQQLLRNPAIDEKEHQLRHVREKHFLARTPAAKAKCREQDAKLRADIAALLKDDGWDTETAKKLAAWDPYDQNASAPFFDPEWMFGIVDAACRHTAPSTMAGKLTLINDTAGQGEFVEGETVKGGFDIVIGNPPYVRQEALGQEFKEYAKEHFASYAGTADLYVYFFEKSHRILRPGGFFTMICSNKYMRSNYGKPLRMLLSTRARILQIIDFGELPVFENAATFPSIILTENTPVTQQQFLFAAIKQLNQHALTEEIQRSCSMLDGAALRGDNWTLASGSEVAIFEKMKKNGIPLGEYVNGKIYRGVLTGLNDAFVIDCATRDQLIAEDARSAELIKPFVVGDDVRKYRINFRERYLIFTRHGVKINNYPAIKKHLSQFKEKLMPRPSDWARGEWPGRKPGAYQWYEIQDTVDYYAEFEKPKIVWPDIAKTSRMSFDRDSLYLANTAYITPSEDICLLAVLNSSVVFKYFKRNSTVLGDADKGGRMRWIYQDVAKIPVPASIDNKCRLRMTKLVEQILAAKKKDADADTAALEREIDAIVYRLYGLTAEEIKIVEGTV